jgi:hypothetical protein
LRPSSGAICLSTEQPADAIISVGIPARWVHRLHIFSVLICSVFQSSSRRRLPADIR